MGEEEKTMLDSYDQTLRYKHEPSLLVKRNIFFKSGIDKI